MSRMVRDLFEELEPSIFVFPIAVVVLASISFVFRLECHLWMWWCGFLLALVVGCKRAGSLRKGAALCFVLIVLMACLWLMINCTLDYVYGNVMSWDVNVCHQPVVRMLAEGWNPVWEGNPDDVYSKFGISVDEICLWHILALPKAPWYFSAVAYLFTGAHFNVLYPLMPILLLSLFYAIYDAVRFRGFYAVICITLVFILFLPLGKHLFIDNVVLISSIGLLISMCNFLTTKKLDALKLIAFSFWMSSSKPAGTFHCLLFWVVFVSFVLYTKEGRCSISKLLKCIGAILLLFCLVNVSPYISSYVNFGHLLYPRYSSNVEKWPVRNITNDFEIRNDDAKLMGHIGSFVNAYVSSDLVKKYYSTKFNKASFCPECKPWEQMNSRDEGTPTKLIFRLGFVSAVLLLCLCCGMPGRFVAISAVAGCLAMPTNMVGYTRYVPWTAGLLPMLILLIVSQGRILNNWSWFSRWIRSKLAKRLVFSFFVGYAVFLLPIVVLKFSIRVDETCAIYQALDEISPSTKVLVAYAKYSEYPAAVRRKMVGNLRLLRRRVRKLSGVVVVEDAEGVIDSPDDWIRFFGGVCCVEPEMANRHSDYRQLQSRTRWDRPIGLVRLVVRSFVLKVPKILAYRIRCRASRG